MNNELDQLVSEVVADEPKEELKGTDYIQLASLILQIVQWLINRWKEKHVQTEAKKVGFVGRALIKNAIKKENPGIKVTNSLLKSVIDKLSTKTDQQISVLKEVGHA